MWGSPEGYGSISRTYERWVPFASSLETSHVRSRSQTCCHLGSITCGSYRCSLAIGPRRLAPGSCSARGRVIPSGMRTSVRIMLESTTTKGAIAEAVITAEAVKLGFVVLRPFPEGRRYDVVIDTGPRLL